MSLRRCPIVGGRVRIMCRSNCLSGAPRLWPAAAGDWLAPPAAFRRLPADAGGAGRAFAALASPNLFAQNVVNLFQRAIVSPLVEVAPDGTFGRQVLGQEPPLAARPQDIKDRVENLSHRGLAGPATRIHRDQGLDQGPLLIREVAGIASCFHPNELLK